MVKVFTNPWKVGRGVEGLELISSIPWSLSICQLDSSLGHLKRGNLKQENCLHGISL